MKRFGKGIDVGKGKEQPIQPKQIEKKTSSRVAQVKDGEVKEIINFVLPPITKTRFKELAKHEYGSFGKSTWVNKAIDELFSNQNWQEIVLNSDPKDCSAREQFTVTKERKNQIKLQGLKLQQYAMQHDQAIQVNGVISVIVRAAILYKLSTQ